MQLCGSAPKHRDEFASPNDITVDEPKSVSSGRLLADIASAGGGDVAKAAKGDPISAAKPPVPAKKPKKMSARRKKK